MNTNRDVENVGLLDKLEQREAGVTELFEFYAGVETVYAAAVKALEEGNVSVVASSANHR